MPIDRAELRGWLEANCPAEMREPGGEDDTCWGGRRWVFQSEAQKLWLTRCVGRGFTVPTWPKEYGGGRLFPRGRRHPDRRDAAHPCPAAACQLRHLDARPRPLEIRFAGTEDRRICPHRARRNPLVPGLFRTGRRL